MLDELAMPVSRRVECRVEQFPPLAATTRGAMLSQPLTKMTSNWRANAAELRTFGENRERCGIAQVGDTHGKPARRCDVKAPGMDHQLARELTRLFDEWKSSQVDERQLRVPQDVVSHQTMAESSEPAGPCCTRKQGNGSVIWASRGTGNYVFKGVELEGVVEVGILRRHGA